MVIGAHTSAAGGVWNALLEGKEIKADTVQFFTSNQKQWKGKKFIPDEIARWKETVKETGLKEIMSHDSYLINLGSPDDEGLQKSRQAFWEETERCVQLGISYLNFHPGAALKEDKEQCLNRICESLLQVTPLLEKSSLTLLLETTAGQGSSVGYTFSHLAHIIEKVKHKIPIGVCIDTCHIFVAGYDIRDQKSWDQTLSAFDQTIGLKYLKAFHVNDSLKDLGSRVDRHAHLGEGKIGWESFRVLMNDPRTRDLPKYLETPGGPSVWIHEIQKLRDMQCEQKLER